MLRAGTVTAFAANMREQMDRRVIVKFGDSCMAADTRFELVPLHDLTEMFDRLCRHETAVAGCQAELCAFTKQGNSMLDADGLPRAIRDQGEKCHGMSPRTERIGQRKTFVVKLFRQRDGEAVIVEFVAKLRLPLFILKRLACQTAT